MHGVLKAGVVPVFNKHILTRRMITYTKEDLLKLKRKSWCCKIRTSNMKIFTIEETLNMSISLSKPLN
jgi:hypothetical protein